MGCSESAQLIVTKVPKPPISDTTNNSDLNFTSNMRVTRPTSQLPSYVQSASSETMNQFTSIENNLLPLGKPYHQLRARPSIDATMNYHLAPICEISQHLHPNAQ